MLVKSVRGSSSVMTVTSLGEGRKARGASGQILLGYGTADPIVIGDEFLDEFVEPILEDIFHIGILQAASNSAREPLRRALTAIGCRDRVEIAHEILVATRK